MGIHYQDGIAWDATAKTWRVRVQVAGRPKKGSAPTKAAATALRDSLLVLRAAQRLGVPVPTGLAPALTLGEAFAAYVKELRQYRKAPRSIREVESIAELWKRALGPGQSAALTREDFGRFVEWASQHTRSQGSQTRKACTIAKTAMRVAGLPVPETPDVAVPRKSRPTTDAEKIRTFLSALEPGTVARVAAELVLRTACREVEARELTIGDVDLKAGRISFERRKGANPGQELAPITPGLRVHLEPWLAGPCRGLPPSAPLLAVWSRRAGQPKARHALTPWTLQKALDGAGEAAGLGRSVRGLGWLRNQALTLAGETGSSVEVLRRAAGHTTSEITEKHYDQSLRWGARVELGAAVDGMLDGPGTPSISAKPSKGARVQSRTREVAPAPSGKRPKARKKALR